MYWSCGVKESIHLPQHPAPNEHVANLSGSTGHIWHHRVVPLLLRPAQGLFGLPPMEGRAEVSRNSVEQGLPCELRDADCGGASADLLCDLELVSGRFWAPDPHQLPSSHTSLCSLVALRFGRSVW